VTNGLGVNFYFGGTSLLIVVGVAMDTVQQIESQLIMRHYDGFSRARPHPRKEELVRGIPQISTGDLLRANIATGHRWARWPMNHESRQAGSRRWSTRWWRAAG
jgi:hypothetical protein